MNHKREISPFICRELLYDYVTGHLDHSRSLAVRECLEKFEEVDKDIQSIKSAMEFCEDLQTIKISESFYKPLLDKNKWIQDIKNKWNEIPIAIRITFGGSCLAALFLGILQLPLIKDWEKGGQLVTFVLNTKTQQADSLPFDKKEVMGKQEEDPSDSSNNRVNGVANKSSFDKKGETVKQGKGAPSPTKVTFKKISQKSQNTKALKDFEEKSSAQPSAQRQNIESRSSEENLSQKNRTHLPVAQDDSTELHGRASIDLEENPSELKGVVFRIFLAIPQLDQKTHEVVSKIQNLGGKKVGDTPLGWRRKKDYYFHFSLPKSNELAFKEYLKSLGSVRIIKDSHQRIMAKGVLQFILVIEETKKTNDKKQQTNTTEVP